MDSFNELQKRDYERAEKSLSQKRKCGVVFSDLECTLIGGGHKLLETWELYGEACKKVSELIDLILSIDNYFVIVSSSFHDAKERVARKYNIIYNCLSEENKNKILFFISDSNDKKGQVKFEQFDDITAGLIGEKVECVDFVLEKLTNEGIELKDIIGIGDDEKDIDMLLRIQELGGQVATVAEKEMYLTNLFSFPDINESTYKSVIKDIADEEHRADELIVIGQHTKKYTNTMSKLLSTITESDEFKKIKESKEKRMAELTLLYESGQIDNDYLQKCLYNAELAFRYYSRYFSTGDNNSVGDGERILTQITSISEYHSNKSISSSDNLKELPKIRKLLLTAGEQPNNN